jgi:hypothetical protein
MLLVFFANILLLAMLPRPSVLAQATTQVSVINPATGGSSFKFYTNITSVGDEFEVTVWVNNVTDLFGWQLNFTFDPAQLNVTAASLPTNDPQYVFAASTGPNIPLGPVYYVGSVVIGHSMLWSPNNHPFNGTGKLANLTLKILAAPPEMGSLSSALDVDTVGTVYTKLKDSTGSPILFTDVDGTYEFIWVKESSSISINLSSQEVGIGDTLTIEGAITPTHPDVNVTISLRPEGGTWSDLAVVKTNSTSGYTYTWNTTGMAAGTYEVMASWPGDADTEAAESEIKSVIVGKASSQISLNLDVTSVTVGEGVTISGVITPIRPNVDVTISYRVAGGTWLDLATVKTNSSGGFSYLWETDQVGEFEIKASWSGDDVTLPAESDFKTINVKATPIGILPWIAVGAVVVVVIAVVMVYYLRKR